MLWHQAFGDLGCWCGCVGGGGQGSVVNCERVCVGVDGGGGGG